MDEWLTTKCAAALLGIPMRQLYRLIDEGHLPAYKHGRRIRLLRSEVAALAPPPDDPPDPVPSR